MSNTVCWSRLGQSLMWLALSAPVIVLASPWAEIRTPSAGPTRVIGAPANGCLDGAAMLPEQGAGYVSVRRHRGRYYGHPDLIRLIEALGEAQQRRDGRLVMIGDLSQPRGGRMASSHRSHQNGLDVDVWLTLANSTEQAMALTAGRADPPDLVRPDGQEVTADWGADPFFLIDFLARRPEVDRLFVSPAIKRALCASAGSDRTWLGKVRPWWGHRAHAHVRLACPDDSPLCEQQAPLPPGDGCGAELAWWFSAEARAPAARASSTRPEPPPACRVLLD
ncbi:MAG: penicillin-insensitive murein endopeptidase [Chromatiaceae bacterium]|nr:penicillin-insensitive murein endopeptidase [Chromatiaceae bacterium]